MGDDSSMDVDRLNPPTGSLVNNQLRRGRHLQIEERIRQLQAVSARARQRQRWRRARNLPLTDNVMSEGTDGAGGEATMQDGENRVALEEERIERAKSCIMNGAHLVAKALELQEDVNKVVGDGDGFFDCNVCLDMAKDPILTCCGHLFCWACFYQLPYIYSVAKECPVCKGEVMDNSITPIYGYGTSGNVSKSEYGVTIPPRPQARRIESVRQQQVGRGTSHVPVVDAFQRIRMQITAAAVGRAQQQHPSSGGVSISSGRANAADQVPAPDVLINTMLGGGNQRPRPRQPTRVALHTSAAAAAPAASVPSVPSSPYSPRLLFEELELYFGGRFLGRTSEQLVTPIGGADPFSSTSAVAQPQQEIVQDSTTEVYPAAATASSSQRNAASASLVQLGTQGTEPPTEANLTEPEPSSSSRRRIRLSEVSDGGNGDSREPRRRRLN
ncbi:uncharacterized protein LOC127801286 [Diospyros lotus]|uniref:uncharacterized protein LOC127801286 n=1 Tax=Diospyros lotus TaxID=55363 RepID=UPI00225BB949|nr:uncharacterized protein LOC127801286 [Diospyros lotus]